MLGLKMGGMAASIKIKLDTNIFIEFLKHLIKEVIPIAFIILCKNLLYYANAIAILAK